MRIALCQTPAVTDDIASNLSSVRKCMDADADMFVFPEMFLTGYFSEKDDPEGVADAVEELRKIAAEKKKCIVIGGPEFADGKKYNSAYIITGTVRTYRKIHLPHFRPFSEKDVFDPGSDPVTFDFMGMRFGICICYDIFFPELMKCCTMQGADVNLVISASPETSRTAFERVFTARPVENTTYVAFINNLGTCGGMTFFGGSRVLSPTGELIARSDDDGIIMFEPEKEEIRRAREGRPTVVDTVSIIKWRDE